MKPLANLVIALSVFVSLMFATALLILHTETESRADLTQVRGPAYVEDEDKANLAWSIDGTAVEDQLISVVYYSPRGEDIAPPPGLSRWPSPGEVAVSPGLLAHREFIETQFGNISETISPSVLLNAGEGVVIVRPVDDSDLWNRAAAGDRAYFASGFDMQSDPVPYGDALYENNAGKLLPLLLISLVPPTFLLVALMRSLVLAGVAREQYILQTMGASRSVLIGKLTQTFWPGIAGGALTACAVQAFLMREGATIPFAEFGLAEGALRSAAGTVFLVDTLVVAGFFLLICLPITKLRAQRSNHRTKPTSDRGLVLFAIGLLAVSAGTILLLKTRTSIEIYFWFSGIILICAGLFSALRVLIRTSGERFSTATARNIIIRWISPNAGRVALASALTGGFAIIGSVIAMVYVTASSIDPNTIPGGTAQHISSTTVSCRQNDSACLQGLIEDVGSAASGAHVFAVMSDDSGNSFVIASSQEQSELNSLQSKYGQLARELISGQTVVESTGGNFSRGEVIAVSEEGTLMIDSFQGIRASGTERIPLTKWYGDADAAASHILPVPVEMDYLVLGRFLPCCSYFYNHYVSPTDAT